MVKDTIFLFGASGPVMLHRGKIVFRSEYGILSAFGEGTFSNRFLATKIRAVVSMGF